MGGGDEGSGDEHGRDRGPRGDALPQQSGARRDGNAARCLLPGPGERQLIEVIQRKTERVKLTATQRAVRQVRLGLRRSGTAEQASELLIGEMRAGMQMGAGVLAHECPPRRSRTAFTARCRCVFTVLAGMFIAALISAISISS